MSENRAPEILDLDVFIPHPRIVRLTERDDPEGLPGKVRRVLRRFGIVPPRRVREIDLSQVSTRTTLQIEKHFQSFVEASKGEDMSAVEDEMYGLMVVACRQSCPDIDRGWLERNTTPEQILRLFEFILEPLMKRAAENAQEMAKLGKKMAAR